MALQQLLSLKTISSIQPLLAFQPLSDSQSAGLNMQIAHKVHNLRMPFHFNLSLLFLPINLQGFGFPSIACINSSLAMSGLQHDLNHHIATFHNIAHITLADWTCQLNFCHPPLSITPYSPTFSCQKHHLPCLWLSAYSVGGGCLAPTPGSHVT
jgi:hypothetical protein